MGIEKEVLSLYEQHINPGLAAMLKFVGFESVEVSARGCIITDSQGEEYLDCLGGFGVMTLGHSHPAVVAAAKEQLERMSMSSRVLFNEPQARLAEKIANLTPGQLQYSFFCNSGAEANEAAIKFARLATGRRRIVAAEGAFHGKTLGALSASGREVYKRPFEPLVPEFVHVPFDDIEALQKIVDEDTAAVILEPIQGEAGVRIPSDDYWPQVREVCDGCGALLIADEVQTGFGRTGKMFAVGHYGVEPDMMTLAKALGGGVVPIGAVVGTAAIWSHLEDNPLLHSSTFGGNPLACATALRAVEVIEAEDVPGVCERSGAYLLNGLAAVAAKHCDLVCSIRGKGLLIGVEFSHEDIGALLVAALAQRKVIVAYTLNNRKVIRFEPPALITEDQMDRVIGAFDEALTQTAELVEGVI